nr:NucA/NucB deoxyribonuclease domain-containing protein [Bacillus sp. V3-13]
MKLKGKKFLFSALFVLALLASAIPLVHTPGNNAQAASSYDATVTFPSSRYPYTADHIRDAIAAGHSSVCTIDRAGADQNREESLRGIPTKKGYDRDEWPMAMCEEGGAGADVRYVPSSDNRGAGAWVGNQLSKYPDGTRVKFYVP